MTTPGWYARGQKGDPGPQGEPGGKSYVATIGDGSTTTFNITHNLGTDRAWLTLRDAATGEKVEADEFWTPGNLNSMQLVFGEPPANNSIRALVIAAGSQGNQGDQGDQGEQGDQGPQGLSAYQVAVANGFSGTQSQWLASLIGPQGEGLEVSGTVATVGDLPSAALHPQELWATHDGEFRISNGTTWFDPALRGPQGFPGGRSYTEVIGDGTTTDFTIEHGLEERVIAEVVDAETGERVEVDKFYPPDEPSTVLLEFGDPPAVDAVRVIVLGGGAIGNQGDQGDPGLSAYEVAVENGFEGTEEEWLDSLKGEQGDPIDGLTATAAELNILDGATVSTAELNTLDGVTVTVAELNVLDGITATVTELNHLDGVTSSIQTQLNGKQASLGFTAENTANKAQANGYASLDGAGKVPITQLPSSIMEYQGTWNASTNSPSLTDGSGSAGDVYRVSTAGTRNLGSGSIAFEVGDYVIYNGSVWEKSDTTDNVASVAGLSGNVSASALTDALTDGSTNHVFTAADDTKLAGIEASADVTDLDNVGGTIHGATGKTTPVDADTVPLIDSAASNVMKKVTWANLKATIKSYYDSVAATLTNKDLTSGTNTFPTFNQNTTGSAATLTTPRTINGVSFNGSANIVVNKPRVSALSNITSVSVNCDDYDMVVDTGITGAITLNNPTGTPAEGQKLWYALTGTASRAISYGTAFEDSTVTRPTTTSSTARLDIGFVYNGATSKWRCVAYC